MTILHFFRFSCNYAILFFCNSHVTYCIIWITANKPNGMIVTEELKNELNQAALATTQAYAACPPLGPSECIKSNNWRVSSFTKWIICKMKIFDLFVTEIKLRMRKTIDLLILKNSYLLCSSLWKRKQWLFHSQAPFPLQKDGNQFSSFVDYSLWE